MTLGLGIETSGGIVLASDSRATVGDLRGLTANNDAAIKIFKPMPRVAVALSGNADTGNALMLHHITPTLEKQPGADVIAVAQTMQNVGKQYFLQNFGNPTWLLNAAGQPIATPRPDIWYLLAGYTQDGKPKLITFPSTAPVNFAPCLSTTGFAAIGVVYYALYHLNRLYRRDISLDVAKDLAAYCIEETASQDGKVGGPLRMAIVRQNQETEIIGDDEIAKLGRRVNAHREALRNSFLTLPPEPQPAPAEPVPELVPGK
jgi:20S proteasome alpha/beta subunit